MTQCTIHNASARTCRGTAGAYPLAVALVVALVVAVIAAPAPAAATVVAGLDREALVRGADGIVAGVVTSVRAVAGPADGPDILTRIDVEISQIYKALPEAGQGTVTLLQTGGTLGGKTLHIHGQAQFTAGESVLLFIERLSDGRLMPFGMAQGKFTLVDKGDRTVAVRALDDLTFAAATIAGPRRLGPADPVRFPVRFELAELETMIVDLVDPAVPKVSPAAGPKGLGR